METAVVKMNICSAAGECDGNGRCKKGGVGCKGGSCSYSRPFHDCSTCKSPAQQMFQTCALKPMKKELCKGCRLLLELPTCVFKRNVRGSQVMYIRGLETTCTQVKILCLDQQSRQLSRAGQAMQRLPACGVPKKIENYDLQQHSEGPLRRV